MVLQYNLQNIIMWLRDLQKRNISFTTKLDLVRNYFLYSITPSMWLGLLIRNNRGSLVRLCVGCRLVLWWIWFWGSKGLLFLGRGWFSWCSGGSGWAWMVERKLVSIWGSLCLHFFIISDLLFSMMLGSPLAIVAFFVRQRLQSWPPIVKGLVMLTGSSVKEGV